MAICGAKAAVALGVGQGKNPKTIHAWHAGVEEM